jgi:hypothetical protein
MVKESTENNHAFSVKLDIAKLNETGDRLLIEGCLGELVTIRFVEDMLEIDGFEGNLKIQLNEKELRTLLNSKGK